jgi:hypothetical protein
MFKLFLSPDEAPGNGPPPTVGTPPPTGGTPAPAPVADLPAPAPPPAARIVGESQLTPREIELQTELDGERERHGQTEQEKKAREIRIAELEDELHRLRQLQSGPAPATAPKKSWWEEFKGA